MTGRFKKVSRIGRGTFGEAWLVTSTCSGRRYVIKEVRVDEMSEEELEKTRTEATILARCKHNSIIRYKEYFMLSNPATMCLVMEYADGGDLAEKVKTAKQRGETLVESTILHWFIQVIFAVQYLHTNNILHRDLKTQNIFLTKTNLVKVGDFGIARFLRDKQDLATTAIGTPYYLSPEICQRRPYNHKSDMWAVGCILYELCALRHPFDAENFEDLVVKILRGAYRPLPQLFTNLIKDLISVLLRTNPERRPTADAILMLPALKLYVENYLQQYEELLTNRINCSSSDDKVPINRSPSSRDAMGNDDNVKVHELDKQKQPPGQEPEREDRLPSYEKENFTLLPSQELVPVLPSARLNSVSSVGSDGMLPGTPPKDLHYLQRDLHSISSPKSSVLFHTPPRKLSSISSPAHPPAPPNTPVNGKLSGTPRNASVLNVSSLYPNKYDGAIKDSSLYHKKSSSEFDSWKMADFAPTPCNTPIELDIDDHAPLVTNTPADFDVNPKSFYDKDSVVTNCSSQVMDSPLMVDSSYSMIYTKKRCLSCGRGLNETYVINKLLSSDSSVDDVFEL